MNTCLKRDDLSRTSYLLTVISIWLQIDSLDFDSIINVRRSIHRSSAKNLFQCLVARNSIFNTDRSSRSHNKFLSIMVVKWRGSGNSRIAAVIITWRSNSRPQNDRIGIWIAAGYSVSEVQLWSILRSREFMASNDLANANAEARVMMRWRTKVQIISIWGCCCCGQRQKRNNVKHDYRMQPSILRWGRMGFSSFLYNDVRETFWLYLGAAPLKLEAP